MANENYLRFNGVGLIDTNTEIRLFAQLDLPALAIEDDFQRRFALINQPRLHTYGLEIRYFRSSRLQTSLLKFEMPHIERPSYSRHCPDVFLQGRHSREIQRATTRR